MLSNREYGGRPQNCSDVLSMTVTVGHNPRLALGG